MPSSSKSEWKEIQGRRWGNARGGQRKKLSTAVIILFHLQVLEARCSSLRRKWRGLKVRSQTGCLTASVSDTPAQSSKVWHGKLQCWGYGDRCPLMQTGETWLLVRGIKCCVMCCGGNIQIYTKEGSRQAGSGVRIYKLVLRFRLRDMEQLVKIKLVLFVAQMAPHWWCVVRKHSHSKYWLT